MCFCNILLRYVLRVKPRECGARFDGEAHCPLEIEIQRGRESLGAPFIESIRECRTSVVHQYIEFPKASGERIYGVVVARI